MKKNFFVAMVSLVFFACGGKNEGAKTENKEATVKSITSPEDEKAKKLEELKKTPQLTLEQMRTLLPHELDSSKEKNYLASTQFGYGLASIEYPKSKSTGLKVTMYDCAGEMGSANYFEIYRNKLNTDGESGQEYTKTIDLMGSKAIENYKKEMNLSTLTFVVRDRLVIVIEGKNMEPEKVRAAAQQLYSKMS
jgi:hypothetical protein